MLFHLYATLVALLFAAAITLIFVLVALNVTAPDGASPAWAKAVLAGLVPLAWVAAVAIGYRCFVLATIRIEWGEEGVSKEVGGRRKDFVHWESIAGIRDSPTSHQWALVDRSGLALMTIPEELENQRDLQTVVAERTRAARSAWDAMGAYTIGGSTIASSLVAIAIVGVLTAGAWIEDEPVGIGIGLAVIGAVIGYFVSIPWSVSIEADRIAIRYVLGVRSFRRADIASVENAESWNQNENRPHAVIHLAGSGKSIRLRHFNINAAEFTANLSDWLGQDTPRD